jgi:hypothetical protein
MGALRFSETSVTIYQFTRRTRSRRRGSSSTLLWELTSHSDDSFKCHPLAEICRRLLDNIRVAMFLFLTSQRNDLSGSSQCPNRTFSCTAAPLTSTQPRTKGQDFRFLQRYCRGFRSCGMRHRVVWCFPTFRKNVLPSSSRSDGSMKTDLP